MDYSKEGIRTLLKSMAEEGYQEFTSGLIPGARPILGVRIPKLRALAKEIAKADYSEYLYQASDELFEEAALHSFVIGYIKEDIEIILPLVKDFIPQIDNWSICDGFCATLKITVKNRERVWAFLQPYIHSNKEFEIRFATIMMMNYFLDEAYIEEVLNLYNEVSHEGYYARMGIAWAVATAYAKQPVTTLAFMKECSLDDWTYNKAIQKMTESYRVSDEDKQMLRDMKRRS